MFDSAALLSASFPHDPRGAQAGTVPCRADREIRRGTEKRSHAVVWSVTAGSQPLRLRRVCFGPRTLRAVSWLKRPSESHILCRTVIGRSAHCDARFPCVDAGAAGLHRSSTRADERGTIRGAPT